MNAFVTEPPQERIWIKDLRREARASERPKEEWRLGFTVREIAPQLPVCSRF